MSDNKTCPKCDEEMEIGYIHNAPYWTRGRSTFDQSWKKELSEQTNHLVEFEKIISMLESANEQKEASKSASIQKEDVWSIQNEEEITRMTGKILSEANVSVCVVTTEMGFSSFPQNLWQGS